MEARQYGDQLPYIVLDRRDGLDFAKRYKILGL